MGLTHNVSKLVEHNESSAKRRTHRYECFKKNLERTYTRNFTAHLKALEQKEENSPKRSRWQEMIKPRTEINQIKTKRRIQRINPNINWLFEKLNKIDIPFATLNRGHRESILINNIRNGKGDTRETEEIKKSSDPTVKADTQKNWKAWMKWIIF